MSILYIVYYCALTEAPGRDVVKLPCAVNNDKGPLSTEPIAEPTLEGLTTEYKLALALASLIPSLFKEYFTTS